MVLVELIGRRIAGDDADYAVIAEKMNGVMVLSCVLRAKMMWFESRYSQVWRNLDNIALIFKKNLKFPRGGVSLKSNHTQTHRF